MTCTFSVLPVAIHQGVAHILLGQNKSTIVQEPNKWSAFGGFTKFEATTNSSQKASDNCYCQSLGLLGKREDINAKLHKRFSMRNAGDAGSVFFMFVKYNKHWPKLYRHFYAYCVEALTAAKIKSGYFEKIDLQWLTAAQLYNMVKNNNVFGNITLTSEFRQSLRQFIAQNQMRSASFNQYFVKMRFKFGADSHSS